MSDQVIIGLVTAVLSGVIGLAWRSIRASFAALRSELVRAQQATETVRCDLQAKSTELSVTLSRIVQLEQSNQQQFGMIELLQQDNADLRTTVVHLNTITTGQGAEIALLQHDGAKKDAEIDRLKGQNHDLFEQNKKHATTIMAYQQFAQLLGRDLALARTERQEPGEAITPDAESNDEITQES